jgi:hypothetical protein
MQTYECAVPSCSPRPTPVRSGPAISVGLAANPNESFTIVPCGGLVELDPVVRSFSDPRSSRRESKRGFADLRELNRSEIAGPQDRANGLFVVKCIDLIWKAMSLKAIASQKAENESGARLEDTACLSQAGWSAPHCWTAGR